MSQARFGRAAALALIVGSIGYGAGLHIGRGGAGLYTLGDPEPLEPVRMAPAVAALPEADAATSPARAVLVATEPFGPAPVRETDAQPIQTVLKRELLPSSTAPQPAPAAPEQGVALAALPSTDAEPASPPGEPLVDGAMVQHDVTVKRGDTLAAILTKLGIDSTEVHAAIASLSDVYDPRSLRVGQAVQVALTAGESDAEAAGQLASLRIGVDLENAVQLVRADNGFEATEIARPVRREQVLAAGTIDDSLYVAGSHAGVPPETIVEFIRLFSWDVDFQRDIQPNSRFELLFETISDEAGANTRSGAPLYAHLSLGDREIETYRFTPPGGQPDYFDRQGRNVRKFLMRTPIDGARLSSGFGMRRHPVLGYSRMHKGTDFAAPTGTPIYAAGSGTLLQAGPAGSFGIYIRIRHDDSYETSYAHMSRLAKGMKSGQRVTQGQVIGYVGTTGRSTGPHLHYEVYEDGEAVNSMSVRQASLESLTGDAMEAFRRQVATIDETRQRLAKQPAVAKTVDKREAAMRAQPERNGRPGSST